MSQRKGEFLYMSTLTNHTSYAPTEGNMAIFGEEGNVMRRLVGAILQYETENEHIHSRYIDPNGQLTPTVQKLGGTAIVINETVRINPFAITKKYASISTLDITELQNRRDVVYLGQSEIYGKHYVAFFPILQKISEAIEFFDLLCRMDGEDGLTRKEIFYLEEALTYVYKDISDTVQLDPTLRDIHTFLIEQYGQEVAAHRLLMTIRPYLRDGNFPYFDGETTLGSDITVDAKTERFVSFDLSELEDMRIRPIAYHLLLRLLKETFLEDDVEANIHKRIYADHFCRFAQNDFVLHLAEEISSLATSQDSGIRIICNEWHELMQSSNGKRLLAELASIYFVESGKSDEMLFNTHVRHLMIPSDGFLRDGGAFIHRNEKKVNIRLS